MTKVSPAAADAWSEARKPAAFWLIEHAASQGEDLLFYVDVTRPNPWSVEKARARRFTSREAAWDYAHANLNQTLVRVRRHF
jgi:hypothetical protein